MSPDKPMFHMTENSTAALDMSSPVPIPNIVSTVTPPRTRIAPQNPFETDPAAHDNGSVSSAEGVVAPTSPIVPGPEVPFLPTLQKNNSAPATPNQKALPRIPQSAPPTLPSAPSNSAQLYSASERRAPTDPVVSFYDSPQQPVFDDDENTEPSSAANTSESGNKDAPPADRSTFSRLVNYTRRKLSYGKESDEEEDMVDGAVISGYLQKLGRNGKWQIRWFETDGECLSYYKSRKRTKLLATLDLEKVGEIVVDENDQKGCSFNIQVLGRLYYLRAENRATCKDWVITLNRVKEARLQQGNVKLLDPSHGPVDLLDANEDLTTPRVVVVANRGRTRAVAETQDWGVLIQPSEENASSSAAPTYPEKRRTVLETVVLGRWSKRKTTLSRIKAKLARWARSVRNLGCAQADSAVQLDHHVHPPGHDYKTSRDSVAKSRPPTASKEVDLFGSHQTTKKTTDVSGVKPSGINRATSTTSVESARFLA
ncbi:hypothetical protein FisN_12Hh293 [Fistulifera solaris]|uniref:PH domain-containing protein n=1 Tax=Fistulifera solaris TaxID=1519565 RepID=A0A1Z5KBY8_FISSO|nr:hypothetical protein FisN_12Hh293 [Fistulifera solaris]|eukprot:GAX23716.1 hypothetical protein FisN_12Hh293 [Fistulifera solaris]